MSVMMYDIKFDDSTCQRWVFRASNDTRILTTVFTKQHYLNTIWVRMWFSKYVWIDFEFEYDLVAIIDVINANGYNKVL